MRELADLAEIHPITRAHQGPVTMHMLLDGMQVEYELDRDRRQLTVVALSAGTIDGNGDDETSVA